MKSVTTAFATLAVGATLVVPPAGAQTLGSSNSPGTATPQEAPVAATPPVALLLDGLGVYVESDYIGVSALTRPLARQGFQTRTDSHLMLKTKGIVPDVIIGHSMGGETALRYATELARAGYKPPMVITIDAAPAPPACTVPRCVNIAGPGFTRVRGARNVSAWDAGARFVNHAQLPTHAAVQELILKETGDWMAQWKASQPKVASKGSKPERAPQSAESASPPAPAPAAPKMWTMPSWSVPGWSVPNWPGARQGG
ncbi:hypothetical protein [Ancylobacter rudongensis]|uniref:Thioesterase domain-containing protein n=1 Tax=Ancylobacter rudongensis TaxID=177413 RepID=A0A1G4QMB1_9HYPH|nr:hypothetical protein [Ancylobacter rudongensis]SCW45773.1 hypothetical protein SAMN05660859_1309 [Ancylobacter rudongensis]